MNYSMQNQSLCEQPTCSPCDMDRRMRMPVDMDMRAGMPMNTSRTPQNRRNRNDVDFDRFPLAMCYVPWQTWNQLYDLEEGLNAGTIFPELNLPFTGRCMTNAN